METETNFLNKLHPSKKTSADAGTSDSQPGSEQEVSKEMRTPTDEYNDEGDDCKWENKRPILPKCSAPNMRQRLEKVQGTHEDKDHEVNKENKQLRVKLSSRFTNTKALQAQCERGRGQSWSPEGSEDSVHVGRTELVALPPGQCMQPSNRKQPLDIPYSAAEDRNLIGDYSKPHIFPVVKGEHLDLQYISAQTVAALLKGKYRSAVESYLIIDCRYPYEYQGGHIKGAVNFHSEAQLEKALFEDMFQMSSRMASPGSLPSSDSLPDTYSLPQGKRRQELTASGSSSQIGAAPDGLLLRRVIVFHCEFSTERGPRLYRYLREMDRSLNVYPQLLYPELYILGGGYREFFSQCPALCDPSSYVPMLHRDFREQLRRFRTKRRSRLLRLRRKQLFKSDS
ncbi:hypothetical protein AGOR_G00201760 [Albula goreensis]|uniref:M-phase inducer phosphatase n=1 Tax=Albula goreensis TaxID=1534307 RepID=A0A8T3CTX2_9TELE|nr:hypothetical protein AGOR_G00201760 [Albula goreensis]